MPPDAADFHEAWAWIAANFDALAGFGEAGVARLIEVWAGELKAAQSLSAGLTLRPRR
ncbi:MAG: hypothetical protein ACLFQ5_12180 [Oceanicaulis sp.]